MRAAFTQLFLHISIKPYLSEALYAYTLAFLLSIRLSLDDRTCDILHDGMMMLMVIVVVVVMRMTMMVMSLLHG